MITLQIHPDGVRSKFIGRLEPELRRIWDKLGVPDACPVIRVVGGRRHEAADAGLAALARAGVAFYQRDKALVRIARIKAKTSNSTIITVPSVMTVSR